MTEIKKRNMTDFTKKCTEKDTEVLKKTEF